MLALAAAETDVGPTASARRGEKSMTISRVRLAGIIGIAACGAASGSGTIVDGDAQVSFLGTSAFSLATGDATLITDAGAIDQLYKYCWYYRTPGNNQNSLMSKWNTPTETYFGDTAVFEWLDAGPGPGGVERFDARLTVHLDDLAATGETIVTHVLRVENVSTATKTFQFFNLIDLDLSGSPLDDMGQGSDVTVPFGTRFALEESSGSTGECFGLAASKWEIGSGSALRAKLSSGAQNLNNSILPYSGDTAVAFQWTVTLAPGESRLIYGGFSTRVPVPCPADFDGNGFVNGDDFDAFIFHFVNGDPYADFDHNGFTNGDDFDPFIELFFSGC